VWVFRDVSRRIFLGQLASHEVTFWQSRAIGNACVIARMLTRAVHHAGWINVKMQAAPVHDTAAAPPSMQRASASSSLR
jgi:hypothetical protein